MEPELVHAQNSVERTRLFGFWVAQRFQRCDFRAHKISRLSPPGYLGGFAVCDLKG
jgi:hypothetical protein